VQALRQERPGQKAERTGPEASAIIEDDRRPEANPEKRERRSYSQKQSGPERCWSTERGLDPNLFVERSKPMQILSLVPVLVTASPVLMLGIVCLAGGISERIREAF
jgi:hypothetical protein